MKEYISPNSNALIVFVRNPELGKVKTRVAKSSSDEYALEIYNRLLSHTREVTETVNATRYLFYTDNMNIDDDWSNSLYNKKLQPQGDLGEKMSTAFQLAFSEGNSSVVIIGSDCPDISPEIIEQAFLALTDSDIVIGPSTDGGYYLLGMRYFCNDIFDGKDWSTEHVLEQTLNSCRENGLSYQLLTMLTDVDEVKDIPQSWLK